MVLIKLSIVALSHIILSLIWKSSAISVEGSVLIPAEYAKTLRGGVNL